MLFLSVLLGCLVLHPALASDQEIYTKRGLPAEVEWNTWWEALALSKENQKPIFVLITKNWCSSCSKLKKQMTEEGSAFWEAARQYNMVSIEENHEATTWVPDEYVPRMFFFGPDGQWDSTVKTQNSKYPNNWSFPDSLVQTMNWFTMKTAAIRGRPIPMGSFVSNKKDL